DPANWATVAMNDNGNGADAVAGDGIYTAVIPAQAANRTLVRYRIVAVDPNGTSVTAPYLDDGSMNFACYVYDGVPDYVAATKSILGAGHVYDSDVMTSLPVYTLIARAEDVAEMMAYNSSDEIPQSSTQAARRAYNWQAAFVYDDVVYDHVDMRLRGANGRYHLDGKRSMRIRFNPGYYLQARDQSGEPYPTKWRQLVLSKMFGNRQDANWGVAESVNNELWRLVDVPSPYTHWFHFRVVDGTEEAPAGANGQYYGDFWGMFAAFERYDVRFLETHDMPKGNLYKLTNQVSSGALQQRYQAPDGATNSADFNNIKNNLNSSRDETWLRNNVDFDAWYRYHAVAEAIKHYDYWPGANKNVAWYFAPDDNNPLGKLWYLPFDSDASWGPTWNSGIDEAMAAIGNKPAMQQEYRNVIREIRDLIFQPEVIEPWIDRTAARIEQFAPAEYDRWEDAPSSAGRHNWDSHTLAWKVADMKKFAFIGGSWPGGSVGGGGQAAYLDTLANAGGDASAIPNTPTITSTAPASFPVDALSFQCSSFSDPQGNGTFAAMEWRIGEITDPDAPAYDPAAPHKFEYTTQWESGEIATFDNAIHVPGGALEVGHTYRTRVRMKDTTGRWSHWSDPVELTTTSPQTPVTGDLRITELMYNPADPTPEELAVNQHLLPEDFEFIELSNTGTEPIDLIGYTLGGGVNAEFVFTSGALGAPDASATPAVLAPGEYAVLARDVDAFAVRYGAGINVAGTFDGGLSNGGEQITLVDPFDRVVLDFTYDDGADWPGRADGKGASLEVLDPAGDYTVAENWHSSVAYGGTPGADAAPHPGVVITEVLSHTDFPQTDSIELHNVTGEPIDVVGWYLSDDWGWDPTFAEGNYKRFRIPANLLGGTTIGPGGYLVLTETNFNPTPVDPAPNHFALNGAHGDDVWLMAADAAGNLTHFADHAEFDAQNNGESWGRWPDADGRFYPMSELTLGEANSGPRSGSVIVSEVHYNPGAMDNADALEFVELYNTTGLPVDLTEWRLRKSVDFNFADGAMLGAFETIVVVPFDPAAEPTRRADFLAAYNLVQPIHIVGPYTELLGDDGDRVQLQRPDEPPTNEPDFIPRLLEDEADYDDVAPWPAGADGNDDSLHREAVDLWGNDGGNWTAATPTPGSVSYTTTPHVAGRHIFYNNSKFDTPTASNPGFDDDTAIATDKSALLPGEAATFAAYTSYSRGINGIMIDLADLPAGVTPDAADFEFHIGNDAAPDGWAAAPPPAHFEVRDGAGNGGSDRVTIIWADGAIRNEWLEVTVLSTNLGLPGDDVFYLGNTLAEAGDTPADAAVTMADLLLARNNPRDFVTPAPIDFPYDFNRDGSVNATDVLLARNNQTNFMSKLELVDLSVVAEAPSATPPAALAWLSESAEQERRDEKTSPTEAAIDLLLAMEEL
ncbi:MAG: lamin tail domain-containing protein, partial [Candidatus Nealsonbacteria bacterium]|nr:lamin tail domain-containing protein [Candidatus Nealsonbacteria bacterium]